MAQVPPSVCDADVAAVEAIGLFDRADGVLFDLPAGGDGVLMADGDRYEGKTRCNIIGARESRAHRRSIRFPHSGQVGLNDAKAFGLVPVRSKKN